MKKKFPFENRPTCSCGVKMKLAEYKGYYEEFRYWVCENCDVEDEMENSKYDPDHEFIGSYR